MLLQYFKECKGDLIRTLETCSRASGMEGVASEEKFTDSPWYASAAAKMAASIGRNSHYHLNVHRNNLNNSRPNGKHER